MTVTDFHTHRSDAKDALISTEPDRFDPQPGRIYSVGLHPWSTADVTEAHLLRLSQVATHPQVAAIGETGFDTLRGATVERQRQIFDFHIDLARQLRKPLVVHCVRAWQHLLGALRDNPADVPVVIHAFRGKPQLARTLIDAGCLLSFGLRFNPEALAATPANRLLIETDDDPADIAQVAQAIAEANRLTAEQVIQLARDNANRLLSPQPSH